MTLYLIMVWNRWFFLRNKILQETLVGREEEKMSDTSKTISEGKIKSKITLRSSFSTTSKKPKIGCIFVPLILIPTLKWQTTSKTCTCSPILRNAFRLKLSVKRWEKTKLTWLLYRRVKSPLRSRKLFGYWPGSILPRLQEVTWLRVCSNTYFPWFPRLKIVQGSNHWFLFIITSLRLFQCWMSMV